MLEGMKLLVYEPSYETEGILHELAGIRLSDLYAGLIYSGLYSYIWPLLFGGVVVRYHLPLAFWVKYMVSVAVYHFILSTSRYVSPALTYIMGVRTCCEGGWLPVSALADEIEEISASTILWV
jgi:hypothetical protein